VYDEDLSRYDELMWPVVLLLGSFSLYLSTLCPTVWVEDSGELISAGYLLGVAHPPGYPLYTLLAKGISAVLPLGSMAFRVNLLSALMAAISAVLVYMVCRRWQDQPPLAAGAAALWAVSHTLWAQARFAEVYTLTAGVVVGVWWLVQDTFMKPRVTVAWALALLYGLGVATHHTLFLLAPLVIWAGWKATPSRLLGHVWGGMLLCFLMGAAITVYLPLRSLVNVGTDWGNPETLSNLAAHLLRRQYGQLGGGSRLAHLGEQWSVYLRYEMRQWTPWLAWLPLAGVIAGIRGWAKAASPHRVVMAASALGWLGVGWGLMVLINFPDRAYDVALTHVFFVPSYFFLVWWAFQGLCAWWPRVLPTALAVGLAAWPAWRHPETLSLARAYAGYDYGFNTLITPSPDGILFTASDNQKFTSAYLKLVEGMRPDLTVYDETGCVFDHILGSAPAELLADEVTRLQREAGRAALETGRPVFHAVGSNLAMWLNRPSQPDGLIGTFGEPQPLPHWRRYRLGGMFRVRPTDEYMLREALAQVALSWSEWWFQRGEVDEAIKSLRRASAIAVDIAPTHNNIAITFAHYRRLEEAEAELRMALELNPDYPIAKQNLEIVREMFHKP